MIKNIYSASHLIFISLALSLLMLSCEGDTPSGSPQSLEIWDEWMSGNHSYYTNSDCSGEGMSFDEYAQLLIQSEINTIADSLLTQNCIDPSTQSEEFCDLNWYIEQVESDWAASDENEEQVIMDEIISLTGIPATSLGSIELLISINMTFDVSYDGFCTNLSEIAINLPEGECNIGGSVWTESGCTFPTENSCPSYIGTWDTGYQGGWSEDDGNYLITWTTDIGTDEQETYTKTLIYSEDLISMIEYSSNELCVSLDFNRK